MLPNFKWILEILKLRARWKKTAKPCSKTNFLESCSRTLISSCLSKPIHSTPFPLNIYRGRLFVELHGKSLVLPRYYKWCCQNKTSFSWSYRDSPKSSLENNIMSRRGREIYTHFEIGGHVKMAKSDPEAQRKSLLSDCTWLEIWVWILSLETLRFLMHFRELGSSL
jgi:hypothetical protein